MTVQIILQPGVTTVTWPANVPSMTNKAVLDDLGAKGFSPSQICTPDSSVVTGYRCLSYRSTGPIEFMQPGRIYLLRNSGAGIWTIPRTEAQGLPAIDVVLYKASVGPAWQNLQANFVTIADATGLMPRLIEFFKTRNEVLRQFGGQTIETVLGRQAAYWAARTTDPKYPSALGFRRQYGYWPNAFESDSGRPVLVGSMTPLPDDEDKPPVGFNFQVILAWAKQNPLLAAGIGLGGWLILTNRLKL